MCASKEEEEAFTSRHGRTSPLAAGTRVGTFAIESFETRTNSDPDSCGNYHALHPGRASRPGTFCRHARERFNSLN